MFLTQSKINILSINETKLNEMILLTTKSTSLAMTLFDVIETQTAVEGFACT